MKSYKERYLIIISGINSYDDYKIRLSSNNAQNILILIASPAVFCNGDVHKKKLFY